MTMGVSPLLDRSAVCTYTVDISAVYTSLCVFLLQIDILQCTYLLPIKYVVEADMLLDTCMCTITGLIRSGFSDQKEVKKKKTKKDE